ncbi:hypothetical protein CVS40_7967 [Lucilia cuprina]|nr:hypothetical protein CVS40_7967 [Lucilia cuprina]
MLSLLGWGKISDAAPPLLPTILQWARMQVITNSICRAQLMVSLLLLPLQTFCVSTPGGVY